LGPLAYAYLNAHSGRMRSYHRKRAEALGKCPHCSLRLDEECRSLVADSIPRRPPKIPHLWPG
jgi:hypothetical protein